MQLAPRGSKENLGSAHFRLRKSRHFEKYQVKPTYFSNSKIIVRKDKMPCINGYSVGSLSQF